MKRSILAVIAGFLVWALVVSLLDRILRLSIEGYAAAEPAFTFTLGMMLSRLGISALSSLAAGATAAAIALPRSRAPWIVGGLLLILFIPVHVQLWARLPAWYHLSFLLTLAPLVAAGGKLVRRQPAAPKATGMQNA